MKQFTLRIPKDVERQLRDCHTSIRQSIRNKLQDIVAGLTSSPAAKQKAPASLGPPLRFYVFEGYRVSYQVNPITRSVVVMNLRAEPG